MTRKSPVAVFSYNRPSHTDRALQALSRSARMADCDFFFYSDGPRSEAARPEVEATREVLRRWAPHFGATVVERPANLGLAKSIGGSVGELCEHYGRAIVVEDDLIVSADFLSYMIEALDRYEDQPDIMQIGGLTLRAPPDLKDDAFLLPVTTTWGWATWKRAWQHFSWVPEDLEEAKRDGTWKRLFDLNGTCSFSSMLEDRLAGRNDSWGILWWYAVSRRRGLVLYPRKSLVRNGGFDGSGVHCDDNDFLGQPDVSAYKGLVIGETFKLPSAAKYEPQHLALLEDFFRSLQPAAAAPQAHGIKGRLKSFAQKLKENVRNAVS
ncbi:MULTISPECIES: hemolysin activation protein [unclassified Sinorhizobium]|uniref:hemolysin activation protein n=1 Tax=unclassified Sinorhizobium TaxID=2613772 RepID=UPI003523A458